MNTNKLCSIIFKVFLALQAIAEVWFTVNVMRLDMLPARYVVILCVVMIALWVLTAALLLARNKKRAPVGRWIAGLVLSTLVICGCLVGIKMVDQAYQTLNKVTTQPQEQEEFSMHIFVRADDPATSIADTGKFVYAIVAEYEEEAVAEALLLIKEQTGVEVEPKTYEDTMQLADALLNGKVDAIIINDAAMIVLSEEEGYENLLDQIRILGSFTMEELGVTEPPTEETTEATEDPRGEFEITEDPFVIYLTGSDTRNKKLKKSRSDVNILAIVNPKTKQVLLVNTPRDYYVPNPAGKGALDKLTNCGIYGVDNLTKLLGNLYSVKVDRYAQINFTGVKVLVDAIGGVTVNSVETFLCGEGRDIQIVKGLNTLNGEEALAFARERKRVSGGDNGRGQNQMRLITAMINKLTSGKTIISNYSAILSSMEGMFRTDVPMSEISALVKMQLNDMAKWNIKSFAVTGTGDSEKTYSSPGHRSYVMRPHQYMVDHATMLINKVMNGEILTDEDVKAPKK